MRRKKLLSLSVILMVIFMLSVGIAAEAAFIQTQKQKIDRNYQESLFGAEISFTIHEGYGCQCSPVRDVLITASGSGVDSQYTDDQGTCVLNLEIGYTYAVTIEKEGYNSIIFEFDVVDDQSFVFFIEEEEDSISHSIFERIFEKLNMR